MKNKKYKKQRTFVQCLECLSYDVRPYFSKMDMIKRDKKWYESRLKKSYLNEEDKEILKSYNMDKVTYLKSQWFQCNSCDFTWRWMPGGYLDNDYRAPRRYSGYICLKCDSGRTGYIVYHPLWGMEILANKCLDSKIKLITYEEQELYQPTLYCFECNYYFRTDEPEIGIYGHTQYEPEYLDPEDMPDRWK